MKHLMYFCSLLILAGGLLAGCDQEPNPAGPDIRPMAAKGKPSADAHPALVYQGSVNYRGNTLTTVNVMDTDATDQTALYRVANSNMTILGSPTWSPSGSSIAFTQQGSGSIPDTIKAIDVSVNSKGEAVGSNLRTVIGLATTTVRFKNPFWCSSSSTGKIAYTTHNGTTESLWVIDESGGTPTEIYRVDTSWVHYNFPLGVPTWNPDDSRLAMIRYSTTGPTTTIMIFNTSTWACVDSISVSGGIHGLEWSRSGMNKLAFGLYASGVYSLYFCDPTTGATPTTSGVRGTFPSWSPNNSSVAYTAHPGSSLGKNVPGTTTTSTISSDSYLLAKWKR